MIAKIKKSLKSWKCTVKNFTQRETRDKETSNREEKKILDQHGNFNKRSEITKRAEKNMVKRELSKK